VSRVTVFAAVQVMDGTGAPGFVADVRVAGERIADVGPCAEAHVADRVVDGSGLTLAPGFVDVHSHADLSPFLSIDDTTKLLQGVTTEVTGNCGASLLAGPLAAEDRPLLERAARAAGAGPRLDRPADVLRALDGARPVTNQAPLVGHAGIRRRVLGDVRRPPTAAEAAAMRGLVDEALDAGAFGLSSGLFYAPGAYAEPDELAGLLEGRRGQAVVYASHIRNEGSGLVDAVAEFLAVGRASGVRLELSHHKAAGLVNWGGTRQTLAMVAQARAEGVEVALDAYPYGASSTSVSANLPPWALEGGRDAALARLADPATRARIRHDCEAGLPGWESMVAETGYDRMIVAHVPDHAGEGRTLAQIAQEAGVAPFDAMADVLVRSRLEAMMIVRSMDEADLRRVLADGQCWIGSDGTAYHEDGKPHPRLTGTFPRVLGPVVRQWGAFSLEEAVRRMTWGPAQWFAVPDRGRIAPGMVADLVLFDAGQVADGSTFASPRLPPVGIAGVWLAGRQVVDGRRFLGERRGRRLRPAQT